MTSPASTKDTQLLTIGKKYLYTGKDAAITNDEALIFIGFNQGKAQFIADNQSLYDLLGVPFTPEALTDYANSHDLDDVSKKLDVTVSNEMVSWISQDEMTAIIGELESALSRSQEGLDKLKKRVFYATDCPDGDTYTKFIVTFKKACQNAGLCTLGFTYHGYENRNLLSIAHHGNDVESDLHSEPSHSDVFFKLKKEPEYCRMNISYMRSTTIPELVQYKYM